MPMLLHVYLKFPKFTSGETHWSQTQGTLTQTWVKVSERLGSSFTEREREIEKERERERELGYKN